MSLNYYLLSKYRKQLMGIAALFITLFHYNEFLYAEGVTLSFIQKRLIHSFNVGVDIFILLSGIGLYFAYTKRPVFKDYYLKRVLNVYVVFLIINLPYSIYYCFIFEHKSILYFVSEWLSVSYFLPSGVDNRAGWYVTFIMILYFLFPLIFRLYQKLDEKKMDLAFTVFIFIVWIGVSYTLNSIWPSFFSIIEIGFTRIPVFLVGCYLGKLVYKREKIGYGLIAFSVFGIIQKLLASKFLIGIIVIRFSQSIFSVSLCFIIVFILELLNNEKLNGFLEFFGGISLELYLIHNMLKKIAIDTGNTKWYMYLMIIAVSIVAAYGVSLIRNAILKKYNSYLLAKRKTI